MVRNGASTLSLWRRRARRLLHTLQTAVYSPIIPTTPSAIDMLEVSPGDSMP